MEKTYNFKNEDDIYKQWEESGYFNPDNLPYVGNETFVVPMPPPNATGTLHLGHASMLVYQDIMVRYHRMKGYDTLWLPGTDHAAIATQTKVEKIVLQEEGLTRHQLGREKLLERIEAFVADSRDTIRNQVRKMGSSCDWSRERYTLDEGLNDAVNEIFIRMYNDGLIYQGHRIVHWCPRCQSTLADDEVEYKTEKTPFYYFKYGPVIIGTARPETKFLDKTIIVHPDDERYKDIVGKEIDVPWINGTVKANVIADEASDMELGTGAMTITPAHSFVDFDLAKKYDLPIVQIINEQGEFTEATGEEWAGKNARASRDEIIEKMKAKGLVDHIDEDYEHNLSVCYRCDTPIEPLVSKQWFMDVNKPVLEDNGEKISLKEKSLRVVRNSDIEIIPERFVKQYFHWMENLHDWCISRQIWFGHRIPVYYKKDDPDAKPIAAKKSPGSDYEQDPDTLDTWFSSGLWTFSTLGWPEETPDLKRFHPATVLETGYDILFFWIARMILMTSYAMNDVPFKYVYLHGLVLDDKGEKMSKSKGNIIDPLDMIAEVGTDPLRLSLFMGASPGNNLLLGKDKVNGLRNFVTKIWNIARFIEMNLDKTKKIDEVNVPEAKTLADEWILAQFKMMSQNVEKHIQEFRFSPAAENLYAFTRDDLADWYLEVAKFEKDKHEILSYILVNLLKLWHPFIPYITETIYQELKENYEGEWKDFLMIEQIELPENVHVNEDEIAEFKMFKSHVEQLRFIKSLDAGSNKTVYVGGEEVEKFRGKLELIKSLVRDKNMKLVFEPFEGMTLDNQVSGGGGVQLSLKEIELYRGHQERKVKETDALKKYIEALEKKLSNQGFLENAPKEKIEKDKQSLQVARKKLLAMTD